MDVWEQLRAKENKIRTLQKKIKNLTKENRELKEQLNQRNAQGGIGRPRVPSHHAPATRNRIRNTGIQQKRGGLTKNTRTQDSGLSGTSSTTRSKSEEIDFLLAVELQRQEQESMDTLLRSDNMLPIPSNETRQSWNHHDDSLYSQGPTLNVSENPTYEELLQLDENNVKVGLDPEIFNQFPTEHLESGNCSICQDSYELHQKVVRTPCCFASFHKDCLKPWVAGNKKCPCCMADMLEIVMQSV